MSNQTPSDAITRQINATLRASNARAADDMARRAAQILIADVDALRDALQDIAEHGVNVGRAIAAEDQAATTADTLALFFGALGAATRTATA